jgi:hypothetical protein
MAAAALALASPTLARERLRPRFELQCCACGYGVVVQVAPDCCPMCRGTTWEYARAARVPTELP